MRDVSERRWYNGRAMAVVALSSLIIGALSAAQSGWVQALWGAVWPGGQLGLLAAACLVAMFGIYRCERSQNLVKIERNSLSRDLTDTNRRLDQAMAEVDTLRAKLDPALLAADRRLYDKLMQLLPSDGAVWDVVNHPFDLSYGREDFRPIRQFVHEWDNAEHTFHDAGLEAGRRTLHDAAEAFDAHLATHAFQRMDTAEHRIYPDQNLDWETDENAFAIQAVRDANRLASEVLAAHQDLIAVARKRFAM